MHIFTSKYTINVLVGGNMQELPVDIPDSLWLQDYFRDYVNPRAKISRLVRQGQLIRLKRGLYISAHGADDALMRCKAANRIYGPSYVSFVYALRWYGLIPEHVEHITSATFNRGRKKRFDTPVGSFFYQDIPAQAYPLGMGFTGDKHRRFLIASPEKALCDELYRISGIRSIKGVETLLFQNLRLDPDEFSRLDRRTLIDFALRYHTTTLNSFAKFLGRDSHA